MPVSYAVTKKSFNELQCSRCAPELLKVAQKHMNSYNAYAHTHTHSKSKIVSNE